MTLYIRDRGPTWSERFSARLTIEEHAVVTAVAATQAEAIGRLIETAAELDYFPIVISWVEVDDTEDTRFRRAT